MSPFFCMKYSLDISNFLEEISSLSHSIAFLYFFALITYEGFLFSPCYSLELCIQLVISFLFFFRWIHLSFSPTLQMDSLWCEPPEKPKNTGVGSLSLLQGSFPSQELDWGLLHWRQILYQLNYQGSPLVWLKTYKSVLWCNVIRTTKIRTSAVLGVFSHLSPWRSMIRKSWDLQPVRLEITIFPYQNGCLPIIWPHSVQLFEK